MKFWAQKKKPHKLLIAQKHSNLQIFYQHTVEIKQNQMFALPKNTSLNKAVALMEKHSQETVRRQVLLNKVRKLWSLETYAEFGETSLIIHSSMLSTFVVRCAI